jgi:hypothetical protein
MRNEWCCMWAAQDCARQGPLPSCLGPVGRLGHLKEGHRLPYFSMSCPYLVPWHVCRHPNPHALVVAVHLHASLTALYLHETCCTCLLVPRNPCIPVMSAVRRCPEVHTIGCSPCPACSPLPHYVAPTCGALIVGMSRCSTVCFTLYAMFYALCHVMMITCRARRPSVS